MAPEGPESLLAACDPAVVETILNARAPSMNALYSNRWKVFASWCDSQGEEPGRCDTGCIKAKRVSELHALSIISEGLRSNPKGTRNLSFLYRRAGRREPQTDCALSEPRSYVDRTAVFQQSDALCATQELLKAVLSKQFSNWIVEAIVQGYRYHTAPIPLGIRCHFTRSLMGCTDVRWNMVGMYICPVLQRKRGFM
ncbi:hypothetical protein N1851_020391 [Merluccius polli]|uniref:Uncharacterized protein n=1 Tax=Merluccius polli TaxID=89951 RepID=A0AA47NYI3_MERPO|nr:hypothetical protein N1851_020391 [Merluccius polli]